MVLTKMIMAIKLGGQRSTTFSDLTFQDVGKKGHASLPNETAQ